MKTRFTFIFASLAVAAVLALGVHLPAFADANDSSSIAEASQSIDALYDYANSIPENPDPAYYQTFTGKADETRRVVSRAHAELANTTEIGEAGDAVESIRLELSDMKKELTAWQAAAEAGDAEAFNNAYTDFDSTVNYYNSAVDAYNAALAKAMPTSVAVLAVLVIFVAIPAWLVIRSVRYKKRVKRGAFKPNKTLATSPTKFLILSFVTFGFYASYWAWRAWQIVGHEEKKKYFSTVRGLFIPLTAIALFPKIKKLAQDEGYKKNFKDQDLAALYFVIYGAATACGLLTENLFIIFGSTIVEVVLIWLISRPVIGALNHYLEHTTTKLQPIGNDWKLMLIFSISLTLVALSVLTAIFGWV